jgi:hypothetical protein
LSKIGAEPAQHVLRRVGVVNRGPFCRLLSAFATRRCRSNAAVTIAKTSFGRTPVVDSILQSQSSKSSTPSASGLPMLHFQRKPFSQEAGRTPPVRFDTADLSGLYPFATARAHHCKSFLRRVNAVTSGFAGGRVLARQVEPR